MFLSSALFACGIAGSVGAQELPTETPTILQSSVGGASAADLIGCLPGGTIPGATFDSPCVIEVSVPNDITIACIQLFNVVKRVVVEQETPFNQEPRPSCMPLLSGGEITPGRNALYGGVARFFVSRPNGTGSIIFHPQALRFAGLLPATLSSARLGIVPDFSVPRFICNLNLSLGLPCGVTGNDIFP